MITDDMRTLSRGIADAMLQLQRVHQDLLAVGIVTYGDSSGFVTLVPLSASHPGKLATVMMHVSIPSCDSFDLVQFAVESITEQCAHLNVDVIECTSDDTIKDCFYKYQVAIYDRNGRLVDSKFEEASENEEVE